MSGRSIHGNGRVPRRTSVRATAAAVAFVFVLGACSDDEGGSDDATDEQIEELTEQVEDLTKEVEEQTQRADSAEEFIGELVEVVNQFPIEVTASLEEFDVRGAYTMTLTEAYCEGLATCGASIPGIRADIVDGANGLELKIPDVVTAGLFAINGSLFAVTDSDVVLDPCGATARVARVSTTIFANGVSVDSTGIRTLTGLGASLLVSTDAVDDCTAGVVFWAATLVPA